MRMHRGWLAAVAAGAVGVGLALGSVVANGAPRVGQPLFAGYTMMTELIGGRAVAVTATVPHVSENYVAWHQNMFALHAAMLRFRDVFGTTRGYVGPHMGGAYGQGSQGDLGYGYMMGGYPERGSTAQGVTSSPLMGGY